MRMKSLVFFAGFAVLAGTAAAKDEMAYAGTAGTDGAAHAEIILPINVRPGRPIKFVRITNQHTDEHGTTTTIHFPDGAGSAAISEQNPGQIIISGRPGSIVTVDPTAEYLRDETGGKTMVLTVRPTDGKNPHLIGESGAEVVDYSANIKSGAKSSGAHHGNYTVTVSY